MISCIYKKDIKTISWGYYTYARDIIYNNQNRPTASDMDECTLFHMGELTTLQVVVLIVINFRSFGHILLTLLNIRFRVFHLSFNG